MKLLFLSTFDINGGAAIASYRLHRGLHAIGISSQLFVQRKTGTDPDVISPYSFFGKKYSTLRFLIDQVPVYFYRNRAPSLWSPEWLPNKNISKKVASFNPDIVHLHWICRGFISIPQLRKISKPIVWTFHDMWPMTGGCHYAGDCTKYIDFCQACPLLGSRSKTDLSLYVWKRKITHWQNLDLTVVTPSRWLAKCAQESALFKNNRIEVIPNGIDTVQFRPIDKITARNRFSLPLDKKLILFGAENATSDKRKGFQLLQEALKIFPDKKVDFELVLFGNSCDIGRLEGKIKIHNLGRIPNGDSLPSLYSASDVFIAPSIQDNLPNTIMESMACGTPVVAFNIGGIPDMIEHKKNGYTAKPFDCQDLADGIIWVLGNKERYKEISQSARQKILQEFDYLNVARRYVVLYEKILYRS